VQTPSLFDRLVFRWRQAAIGGIGRRAASAGAAS
jgi:hypothetical protein